MRRRMICVQHRLAGMGGHRFNQSLGLLAEAAGRGMEPVLLMNAAADEAVRRALPGAAAVLHDPVFRLDLSFDQRTAAFVDLLHRHVDPHLGADDRVLVTVATQCEGRALGAWLGELPRRRRPWVVALFPSDRWNRAAAAVGAGDAALAGPARRAEQLEELRIAGAHLAALPHGVRRRLLLCTHTDGLRDELAARLGMPVFVAPMLETMADIEPAPPRDAAAGPPRIGVPGGSRPDKGSSLLPAVVAATRRLAAVRFVVQGFNEQLTAEAHAAFLRLAEAPDVELLHLPLDRAAYLAFLAAADLLLLPYERTAYRHRSSGILSEAVTAAIPVVVPSDTWMAQQVETGLAAGVVYPGDDPDSIAAALGLALAHLPTLRDQARQRAPAWRRLHGLPVFLDRIESEIAARSLPAAAARAAAAVRQLRAWLGPRSRG